MELKQLRYFIAVAEHLNFTEASKQLFVAQSAVSQQVADLEKEIGVKLLIRNKRTVKLTSAGSIFLKEVKDAINKSEIAVQKARLAASGQIGSIRIGFINSAVRTFMPQMIRNFRSRFPNIDLNLHQKNLAGVVAGIESGKLDLGYTLSLGLNKNPEIVWEKIYTDCSYVVVHAEHPLANKDCVNIGSLAEEQFIVMLREESPEGFDFVLKLCSDHGFSPRIVSSPTLMETIILLVEAGMGIAIVPGIAKLYVNSNLRYLKIEGDVGNYDVSMIWRKNNTNPSLSIFLDEIRKELSQVI